MRPREWVGTACGQQLRDLVEPLPTITIECHSASAFDFHTTHKKGFFSEEWFHIEGFQGDPTTVTC